MDGEEGTAMRDVYVVKPTGIANSLDIREEENGGDGVIHQGRNIEMEDDEFSFDQVEFEVLVEIQVDMSRRNWQ